MLDTLLRTGLVGLARLLTGVRAEWPAEGPPQGPCVFFANHVSHADFVLIWAVLPQRQRRHTRPVAGADYWRRGRLRSYIGERVVRAVLIEREGRRGDSDPIAQMGAVVDAGDKLILFPEGTRNLGDEPLLPLKSGIWRLARERPQLPLVPAWIDNLHRVLPKGEWIPVPLLCTVRFGSPIFCEPEEAKAKFLDRAREALLALRPGHRA